MYYLRREALTANYLIISLELIAHTYTLTHAHDLKNIPSTLIIYYDIDLGVPSYRTSLSISFYKREITREKKIQFE